MKSNLLSLESKKNGHKKKITKSKKKEPEIDLSNLGAQRALVASYTKMTCLQSRINMKKKLKIPFRSEKAGRFEKLLGFARSHSIVTRGSVRLSCATTPHPACLSKS